MPRISADSGSIIALQSVTERDIHLLLAPNLTKATPWLEQLSTPWLCLDQPERIPSSANTAVYRGYLGDTTVYLKQFFNRSRSDAFKNLFRPHRALRALHNDQLLSKAGFSAPVPVIFGYRQKGFVGKDYFYVTRALEGYYDLYIVAEEFSNLSHPRQRQLIRHLADTIGRLHREGFFHGDLRPGNVMIKDDNTPDIALLDNERTRQYQRLPSHQRIKNLTQLNMLLSPHISVRHRLCFFVIYCRAAGINRRQQLLKQVAAKTRQRLGRMVKQGRIAPEQLFFQDQ